MIKALMAGLLLFASGEASEPIESVSETPEETVSETIATETTETAEEEPKTDTQVIYYVPEENAPKDFWGWLKSIFTPEVIASIVSALTAAAALLKLASSAKVLAGSKKKDEAEIHEQVEKAVRETVARIGKEAIQPIADKIEAMTPTLDAFAKVLALSDDQSPTAKIARLELLQRIGGKETKEIAQTTKEAVEKQAKESQERADKAIAQLDEIIGYDGTKI